jgi:hypothetical protein
MAYRRMFLEVVILAGLELSIALAAAEDYLSGLQTGWGIPWVSRKS